MARDGTLGFFALRDSLAEAQFAAALSRRMLEDGRAAQPSDIALLVPETPTRLAHLAEAFADQGVPLSGLPEAAGLRDLVGEVATLALRCLRPPAPAMALASLAVLPLMPWPAVTGAALARDLMRGNYRPTRHRPSQERRRFRMRPSRSARRRRPPLMAFGTGGTTTGVTKTVNLGTGGVAGSTTVINLGSTTAGALGMTVINTPTVTFASSVTAIGAAAANVTALGLGLGGASPDASNRLSVNAAATLLNNAGGSHEATINKAASGNDASLALKTGFSARALFGLLGSDDVTLKVSPNGSAFFDAFVIDRATGRAEFPEPLILPGLSAIPAVPPAGKLALYCRQRAGAPWLEVVRPSGRDFPLQPHTGLNRIGIWAPVSGTTIAAQGIALTIVGTVSHTALTAGSLLNSSRRWRVTSAAVVDSVCDQREAVTTCWRGNAAGLGGFTFVARISLTALQATGMGFFGLLASIAALAVTTTLTTLVEAIGLGFQRGTHANWQLVRNDATGAPTLVDLGAGFPVVTAGLITLTIWCPAAGTSIWLRAVNELTGAVFEQEVTTDLPQAATFLAPRLFLNNGATAAAVAFESTGLYLETDF